MGPLALRLYLFYLEQYAGILAYLPSLRKEADEEGIHQVRLCLKRVKLVYRYIDRIYRLTPDDLRESLRESKGIYRSSGRIRDLQVQVGMLQQYNEELGLDISSLLDFLSRKSLSEQKRFRRILKHLPPAAGLAEPRHLVGLTREAKSRITLETARNELFVKFASVRDRFGEWLTNGDESTLHSIRRELKEMYFILIMSGKKSVTYKGSRFRADKLRNWEQLIGKWHDAVMLRQTVQEFLRKQDTGQSEAYSTLRDCIDDDIHRRTHFIRTSMPAFLSDK